MTLDEIIRKRGSVVSWLDLLELMEEFDLVSVFGLARLLGVSEERSSTDEDPYCLYLLYQVKPKLKTFIELCDKLDLDATVASARRLEIDIFALGMLVDKITELNTEVATARDSLAGSEPSMSAEFLHRHEDLATGRIKLMKSIHDDFASLNQVFNDQVVSRKFYFIEPSKTSYASRQLDKEWSVICKAFPKVEEHIRLANECFALDQPTACVYHLCCAVEFGIRWLPVKFKGHGKIAGIRASGTTPAVPEIPATGIVAPDLGYETWGKWRIRIAEYTTMKPLLYRELDRIEHSLHSIQKAVRDQTMHPNRELKDADARLMFDAAKAVLGEITALKGKKVK